MTREDFFLKEGAVTVEVPTQLRNDSSNNKRKKAIRNQALIQKTLIIRLMIVTAGNKIRASYADWMII